MKARAKKQGSGEQGICLRGRLGAILLVLILVGGCSTLSTRVDTLSNLHRAGKYEEMAQSPPPCDQERPECVKMDLLLADAHMHLGHVSQAGMYADDALRLSRPKPRPGDAALAYQIKGIAALQGVKELQSPDQQAYLFSDAASYLRKSLSYEREMGRGRGTVEERARTLESLCETYVRWGDVSLGAQSRKINEDLLTCGRDLRDLGRKDGIGNYYFNRAQFRLMSKQVTDALFGGTRHQKDLVAANLAILLREVRSWDGKITASRYAKANRALSREIQQRITVLRR